MDRLKGKVAIGTGGSVAIFDVMDAEGGALAGNLGAKGRDVVFMTVDVSDEAAVTPMPSATWASPTTSPGRSSTSRRTGPGS